MLEDAEAERSKAPVGSEGGGGGGRLAGGKCMLDLFETKLLLIKMLRITRRFLKPISALFDYREGLLGF